MRKTSVATAFLMAWAGLTLAEPPPDTTAIKSQDRLVHEGIVEASVDEVWKAFTTKEGLESWLVPHAEIELKVGGKMLTHYDPKGKLGDPNTIENTILSYDPRRMLSIKATKPPADFPFKKSLENMWSVLYFEEVGPKRTKVTVIGLGYGDDEESKKMREHFNAGNDFTLKRLQKRFALKEAKP